MVRGVLCVVCCVVCCVRVVWWCVVCGVWWRGVVWRLLSLYPSSLSFPHLLFSFLSCFLFSLFSFSFSLAFSPALALVLSLSLSLSFFFSHHQTLCKEPINEQTSRRSNVIWSRQLHNISFSIHSIRQRTARNIVTCMTVHSSPPSSFLPPPSFPPPEKNDICNFKKMSCNGFFSITVSIHSKKQNRIILQLSQTQFS